jgi:hypothetical protein
MTASPSYSVSTTAAVDPQSLVIARARWGVEDHNGQFAVKPIKGTWYGHIVRGRAAHDITVIPMLGCPGCGNVQFLSHSKEAAARIGDMLRRAVPVVHRIDHLGKVSPDMRCAYTGCGFHRKVYLDRWNKTKPLYACAYVEGARGKIEIMYSHSVDAREAKMHMPKKGVRIIATGPAIGFFVDEATGRVTAD